MFFVGYIDMFLLHLLCFLGKIPNTAIVLRELDYPWIFFAKTVDIDDAPGNGVASRRVCSDEQLVVIQGRTFMLRGTLWWYCWLIKFCYLILISTDWLVI